MADDLAQQILAPVQADNSVKALAWDAFNQATDPNDLAMRLKVLGLPNSVKADLWDAKSGNYNPAPNAGLAGVARPQNPIPAQDSGLQRFANSAGIPTGIGDMGDVKEAVKNLLAPKASQTSPRFGQTLPIVGPMFRAQRETYDQPGIASKVYGSIPLVGPIGYQMGKQLESGDYAGAGGSGLNILLQMLGAKGTNLPKNLAAATSTLGDAATAASPYVGKAAGATVTGAGIYKTIQTGNPEYLLSALAKRASQSVAESATAGTGSLLKRIAAAMQSQAPEQFGTAADSKFLNSPGINGEIPVPQRLALPPAQIELGPSSTVPARPSEGLLPAARVQMKDPSSPTGFRDQFVTSVADPNQNLSLNQARSLRTPQSIDEFHQMLKTVQEMNAQEGAGADIVDQRMAEYAKSPVDKMQMRTQLGKPQPTGIDGISDYPIIKNGQRIGHARISISGDEARVGWFGPDERATGTPLDIGGADARALKTQFEAEHPGVKLKLNPGSATAERAAARVTRREALVPKIGPFSAPVEVNNNSDLMGLLKQSLQQARTRK